jgi:hypothetical protein
MFIKDKLAQGSVQNRLKECTVSDEMAKGNMWSVRCIYTYMHMYVYTYVYTCGQCENVSKEHKFNNETSVSN